MVVAALLAVILLVSRAEVVFSGSSSSVGVSSNTSGRCASDSGSGHSVGSTSGRYGSGGLN